MRAPAMRNLDRDAGGSLQSSECSARTTAIELSGEILKHDVMDPLLHYISWQVEVSDSPELGGRSLFVLQFSIEG
jgi:hypothetical protein